MAFCREIFGPLLPVVPVEDLDEAIKFVNERLDFFYIYIHIFCYLIRFTQRPSFGALCLLARFSSQDQRLPFSLPSRSLIPSFDTISVVFNKTQSGAAVANETVLHPGGTAFCSV